MPPKGLVVYCGTIITDEGKEKKVNIDFEPFKPINTSLYLCDNKFHTEALDALLADDNRYVAFAFGVAFAFVYHTTIHYVVTQFSIDNCQSIYDRNFVSWPVKLFISI